MRKLNGNTLKNTNCDDSDLNGTSSPITHDHFMDVVNANYGHYIKRAYGYVKCMSLAEDAVQDGILTAYTKLDTLRDIDALNSWISRIITHKALDILRKNKRMPDFYGDIDDVLSYNSYGQLDEPLWAEISTPEQDIMKKENLQKINECVEGLEDIYRIPLLLKDHEDFSIKEISEFLNITESNAKIRIHRARIKVKLKLGSYFFPQQHRDKS
ncbi:MAG: RNA polymerase sigma factor [Litorimonas sp.]